MSTLTVKRNRSVTPPVEAPPVEVKRTRRAVAPPVSQVDIVRSGIKNGQAVVEMSAPPVKAARSPRKSKSELANEAKIRQDVFTMFEAGRTTSSIATKTRLDVGTIHSLRVEWEESQATKVVTKPVKSVTPKVATVTTPPKVTVVSPRTTKVVATVKTPKVVEKTVVSAPKVKTERVARGIGAVKGKPGKFGFQRDVNTAREPHWESCPVDASMTPKGWEAGKLPWNGGAFHLAIYSRAGVKAYDLDYPTNVYYRNVSFQVAEDCRDYVNEIVALNGGTTKTGLLTTGSVRISIYRNSTFLAQNDSGKWIVPIPARKVVKTPTVKTKLPTKSPAKVVAPTVAVVTPAKRTRTVK